MVYLVLSILFMSLFAVLVRAGSAGSGTGMLCLFRCVGGCVGAAMLLMGFSLDDMRELLPETALLAGVGGVVYWFSGWLSIKAVQTGPLGISWTVLRLSMLIPTAASILYWHEIPLSPLTGLLVMRLGGVFLSVAGVTLMCVDHVAVLRGGVYRIDTGRRNLRLWAGWLTVAFVVMGAWEVVLRAGGTLPTDRHRVFLIGWVFVLSMVISIPPLLWRARRLSRRDWWIGIVGGLCAAVGSGLRPLALSEMPGTIVFPVTAIFVTLLVLLAGVVFWKERLGWVGLAGALVSLGAIFLLAFRTS